ncbi:MAG TPA: TIGR03435 family protein [Bryobacteraceae bacterium]
MGLLVAFGAWAQEFDVASIKPAGPQPNDGRQHTRISVWSPKGAEPGKLDYYNISLVEIIGQAYRVQQNQIESADSLLPDRFDIHAVIPAGTAADKIPPMLQTLLRDRFKLALHRETRQLPVYALTTAKNGSKLKPAESASGITSDTYPTNWHISAKTTMPQFAEFLARKLDRLVVDETSLSGVFEIVLDAAPYSLDGSKDASGPSIFTALQEQLGLKLEARKAPVEILVVDRAGRPSEN